MTSVNPASVSALPHLATLPADNAYDSLTFHALGTQCQITFQAASVAAASSFKTAAATWVHDFERRYSRFNPDSLISRINAAAGREWIHVDTATESLFSLCDWFHWLTRGAFDPAILPLLDAWDYRNPAPRVPDANSVAAALRLSGWSAVRRKKGMVFLPEAGMGLDLGGIGKEYAVDCVIQMGRSRGIHNILVNFGNDLRVHGSPPEGGAWRIGLEDPFDPGRCWDGVALQNRAVTTSGDYHRHFESGGRRYGHILDPRTGYPVDNGCKAVTVVAPTCTEAGILSTTAVILGRDDGLGLIESRPHTEGCLWHQATCYETRGFHEYLISN